MINPKNFKWLVSGTTWLLSKQLKKIISHQWRFKNEQIRIFIITLKVMFTHILSPWIDFFSNNSTFDLFLKHKYVCMQVPKRIFFGNYLINTTGLKGEIGLIKSVWWEQLSQSGCTPGAVKECFYSRLLIYHLHSNRSPRCFVWPESSTSFLDAWSERGAQLELVDL